jgi:hypothetical protein
MYNKKRLCDSRKRNSKKSSENWSTLYENAAKVLKEEIDDYSTFGEHVASELRGIRSEYRRNKLKLKIQRALTDAAEEDSNETFCVQPYESFNIYETTVPVNIDD